MGEGARAMGRIKGGFSGACACRSPLRPLRVHLPRFGGEDFTAPSQLQGNASYPPLRSGGGAERQRSGGGLRAVDPRPSLRPRFFIQPQEERIRPGGEAFQDAGRDGQVLQRGAGLTAKEAREAQGVFFRVIEDEGEPPGGFHHQGPLDEGGV